MHATRYLYTLGRKTIWTEYIFLFIELYP